MPSSGHGPLQLEPRTVTDYQVAIDYFGFFSGEPGTIIKHLGIVSEAEAIAAAHDALEKDTDRQIWRVEIWSREIPIDWQKVEEIRR